MREELPSRAEFAFFHPLRVRWSEVDPQGIVFNPNYLVYADIAMTEYMRAVGLPYPEAHAKYGADVVAVRAETDFVSSAVYDDNLELAARVDYIGVTSFRLKVVIFRGGDVLTQVRLTYVHLSLTTKKPAPLADDFIAVIEGYERTAPRRK